MYSATPAASTGSGLFGISAPTATSAIGTTSTTSFPSIATTSAATTSAATLAPASTAPTSTSLFGTSNLGSGSSLFGTSSSQAAASTLLNAAGKGTLGGSTATTASSVQLTPDTIALSTKYTELPADAKAALDQFHRPSESLDNISKQTMELSKRLATIKDALDRDSRTVQEFQDRVDQELKQADSAGRIIEAYGSTSQANFLYAGSNSPRQYFEEKCLEFEAQLRQFRTTIEDIERHLASYSTRNPQVAHALTEVLRNQHEGFLAIARQVALLHDDIKSKEKAFVMFRRKYFDDDTDPFQTGTKQRKTNSLLLHHTTPTDGQQSLRDFAKKSLRSVSTSTTPAASTAKAPGFGSLTAPATSTATTSGFGAFGAPAT
ncbi:Nucleoporin p58/p45, partial [Podila epigama]